MFEIFFCRVEASWVDCLLGQKKAQVYEKSLSPTARDERGGKVGADILSILKFFIAVENRMIRNIPLADLTHYDIQTEPEETTNAFIYIFYIQIVLFQHLSVCIMMSF